MTSAQVAANGLFEILDTAYWNGMTPRNLVATPTAGPHLLWMLRQIIDGNLSSETKENRWLGFVQGVMVARNLLDVEEERNRTREIFNGE